MGFLFAPVNLLRRPRVFFKITSVVILTFFGTAILSELVLLVCNWAIYSLIAGFTALLIASHRGFHSDPTEKKNRANKSIRENAQTISNADKTVVQEGAKKYMGMLLVLMEYFTVVFRGIPWIMMNQDIGVGFTRRQSWVVILAVSAFIILCLLMVITLGANAVGTSSLRFYVRGIQVLWAHSKRKTNLPAISQREEGGGSAHPDRQRATIQAPSASQRTKAGSSTNIVEEHSGSMGETVAVDERQQNTIDYMDAAQTAHSSAKISSGESSRQPEQFKGNRDLMHVKEKVRAVRSDGERLDKVRLNPKTPPYATIPAATAPKDDQPRRGLNKVTEFSEQVSSFWNEIGRHDEDPKPQPPSWINWALSALPYINFMCVIWSILSIELTIKWNNITEVHTIKSVGQLIPLVVGIVGFLKWLRDISVQRSQLWIYRIILVRYLLNNIWSDSFSLTICISGFSNKI